MALASLRKLCNDSDISPPQLFYVMAKGRQPSITIENMDYTLNSQNNFYVTYVMHWQRRKRTGKTQTYGEYRTSSAHAKGITPNVFMLRHPRPHSVGYGGIAEIVSRYPAIRATKGNYGLQNLLQSPEILVQR